eukprot:TRINITY_DN22509_c0_g1_i1.p1 TRINITY_DN22509_c0_g1~~TRINITY_DN22509_c0_g1_i1.p1  ORF type:complete len:438 (+),score=151.70 TRINITY_DN22509_c0_g1_i1:33-1346(+)
MGGAGYAEDDCEAPDSYATPEKTPQPLTYRPRSERGPGSTLAQARLERHRQSPPRRENITDTLQRQMNSLEGLRVHQKRSTYVRTTSPSVHSMQSGYGARTPGHPHAERRGARGGYTHSTPYTPVASGDRGGSGEERWEADRISDLQVQLEAMRTQLANRDDKLRTLKECLRSESDATAALQQELLALINAPATPPAPAGADAEGRSAGDLEVILQSEKRLTQDAARRLQETEASFKMTEDTLQLEVQALRDRFNALRGDAPSEAAGGLAAERTERLGDIKAQMLQKLQRVTHDMEAQFAEERAKLENRIEYLTRMNDRKDHEVDTQKNRRAEISNLIGQARSNHKALMQGLQAKYEHERRETLQHESNAAKHERELRLKTDECEKLRERLRKVGSTSQKAAPTPAKKRPGAASPFPRSTASSRASTTLSARPCRIR